MGACVVVTIIYVCHWRRLGIYRSHVATGAIRGNPQVTEGARVGADMYGDKDKHLHADS